MHLFHDSTLNTWRLITEQLPEKPKYSGDDIAFNFAMADYYAAIAALKQNALTVGNIEITGWEYRTIYKGQTERQVWTKQIDQCFEEIKSDELYFWPGQYTIKDNKAFLFL